MLRVDPARWDQTPADLRELAMSASHPRTRERFLALYEITQESCATRVAAQARRHPQTVMEWLHLYNTRGPAALIYQRTGGRPPFARRSRAASARQSMPPNAQPQRRR
jgi:transposase